MQFDKNVVYAVEDRNQDIWVSTFRGVFRFDQDMRKIYQHIKGKRDLSDLVLSMYADPRGYLWFASNDKIERLNLATGMSDSIHINNALSPIAMLIDSHENIWLGNYTHISKYDFKTRTLDSLEILFQRQQLISLSKTLFKISGWPPPWASSGIT